MTAGPSAAVPIWMIGLILYLSTDVYLEQLWPWSWWRQRKTDYLSCVLDHLAIYSAEVVTLETVSVLRVSYVPYKSFLISRLSLPGEKIPCTRFQVRSSTTHQATVPRICATLAPIFLSSNLSFVILWNECVCVCVCCPSEFFMRTQYLLLEESFLKKWQLIGLSDLY